MSRSSAVTARLTPVEQTTSAAAGALVIHGECLTVETNDRIQVVDLTDKVMDFARQFHIREGTLTLWSMHTTCALFVNESQKALLADITKFLEDIVARDRYYMHNDPEHSDCDRMNADAHLRATLLGHSLTVQISGGELVLGQWQRILMAELDGPRTRTLRSQVMGIAD
jgi:secondary thiamine-phosphate synthase enzyme